MQEIPLEETVYKATTEDTSTAVLKPEPIPSRFNVHLYFVAAIANLLGFSVGTAVVWVAPVLPKLLSTDLERNYNPFGRSITNTEASWIAGLLPLGAIFGPLLAGKVADKIGRKKTLLVLALLKVCSLLITAYATTVLLYYISRFLIGVAIGTCFAVLPMYLAEIAENHNRGTLACSMGVFIASGFNFTFLIGPYLSVKTFSLICLSPLALFLPLFLILCPETPVFLASLNNQEKLLQGLKTLRRNTKQEVQTEMMTILEVSQKNKDQKSGLKDLLKSKCLRKGLIISLGLISLQQSAGVSGIFTYLQTIFEATGSKLKPEICAMITGSFQVLGTLLASIIVDRAGRKILLLLSSVGMTISLLLLALYFYLKSNEYHIVDKLFWLPVLSLVILILFFSIGLGPVPWAVMAEIFPSNVRSLATSLTSVTCFLNTFLVTVTFPSFSASVGMSNCFLIFAGICTGGTLFIFKSVPETKGKSLQEIQKLLENGK